MSDDNQQPEENNTLEDVTQPDEQAQKSDEPSSSDENSSGMTLGGQGPLAKLAESMPSQDEVDVEEDQEEVEAPAPAADSDTPETIIFCLRTTANREDQVMSFISANAIRRKLEVYSLIHPHGMRGYIFVEAGSRSDAEQAAFSVPYSKGLLPNEVDYSEIEHMLDQVKREVNIRKNDIAEIISGPFKREKCKITRVDMTKEEVVVELLEAAVSIPITLKIDAVRVIRREGAEEEQEQAAQGPLDGSDGPTIN